MAAPTIIYLSTGKVGTNGTDKSVPYDHEFLCRPYSDMRNRQACSLRATGGRSGELIAFLFNPSAAKLPAPLDRGTNGVRCKTQQRTNVTRGNHGLFHCLEPGHQR